VSELEQLVPPPSPLKQDPESLTLRGRPRPVIRFRKGLIIGLTGTALASLVLLTWVSLEPPSFRFAAIQDAGEPAAHSSPDVLAGAPGAYSDVPRLGPPLPGDLGRPILEQQRELAGGNGLASTWPPDPEAERAAADGQRRAEQQRTARASPVLFQLSKTASAGPPRAKSGAVPLPQAPEIAAVAPEGPQMHKQDFARSSSGDIDPHIVTGPVSLGS
jgi:type IV secretion system protein VirB10